MKLRVWLSVLSLFAVLIADESPGDEQEALGFADHLFKQRDYYRAITEYERFTYMFPTNPLACRARYSLALCYCSGGKFEAALPALQSVKDAYPGRPEAADAALAMAEVYYRMGNFSSAQATLEGASAELRRNGREEKGLILAGLCSLRMEDKEGAVESARKVAPESGLRLAAVGLEKAAADFPEDEKSPRLAGALSAVLPGAGKLYIGRRRDAVTAFVLNGLFIAGIVSAFHNDEPVTGVALSILEVSWYSGNIYGAVNGAHKRNEMRRQRFFGEVEFRLNILSDWTPSGTSTKPAVGVGARF